MRLTAGKIPLSRREESAVSAVVAKHPGVTATLSRRDPGELGPVLVQIGESAYEIDSRGRSRRVR